MLVLEKYKNSKIYLSFALFMGFFARLIGLIDRNLFCKIKCYIVSKQ